MDMCVCVRVCVCGGGGLKQAALVIFQSDIQTNITKMTR